MRKLTEMLGMVDHDEKCASMAKNRKMSVADADDFISAIETQLLSEEQLEEALLEFRTWIAIRNSLPNSEFVASLTWPSSVTKAVCVCLPEDIQISFKKEAEFRRLVELFDAAIVK